MQASSEHSVCFAVPEKEVKAVAEVLESRFKQALGVGRISQVLLLPKIPLSVFVLLIFHLYCCLFWFVCYRALYTDKL